MVMLYFYSCYEQIKVPINAHGHSFGSAKHTARGGRQGIAEQQRTASESAWILTRLAAARDMNLFQLFCLIHY